MQSGRPLFSETVILVGRPFKQIIEHSETNDASAIILASKGHRADDAHGLGVTPSRVVRHATTPVLVIKMGHRNAQFKRILSSVNMSDSSARALRNAARLARACKAELTDSPGIHPARCS